MNKAQKEAEAKFIEDADLLLAMALGGRLTKAQFSQRWCDLNINHRMNMYALGGGNPESKLGKAHRAEVESECKKGTQSLANDIFAGKYNES